jgi:hypothetical protein
MPDGQSPSVFKPRIRGAERTDKSQSTAVFAIMEPRVKIRKWREGEVFEYTPHFRLLGLHQTNSARVPNVNHDPNLTLVLMNYCVQT